MTICNMSVEAEARAGIIAPDEKTFFYVKERPKAPRGDMWERAKADWMQLQSDEQSCRKSWTILIGRSGRRIRDAPMANVSNGWSGSELWPVT